MKHNYTEQEVFGEKWNEKCMDCGQSVDGEENDRVGIITFFYGD